MMSLFDDDALIFDDDEPQDEAPSSYTGLSSKLVPPQHNPLFFGHEKQEKMFLDLFEKGSLPHAVIFSGPQGVGKTTFAFRLARFLLKHGVDDPDAGGLFGAEPLKHTSLDIDARDPVFTRVASGGHPDFRYFERSLNTDKGKQDDIIKVEIVRKIEPFLRMKSSNGGWRVVILEDADTMNRNAQNAILKILEEPPAKVLLILIAHRSGALIPTIRSRARLIHFQPLSDQIMQDLLAKQGYSFDKTELELLHTMSRGSIGQALRLADEGGMVILKTILDHLNDERFPNWVNIHDFAQELSAATQEKEYRLFTEITQWIFRQLLFAKAKGENTPPSYLSQPRLAALMRASSLEKLSKICDDLKSLFARTDFSNLDKRDAVRGSFLVISQ